MRFHTSHLSSYNEWFLHKIPTTEGLCAKLEPLSLLWNDKGYTPVVLPLPEVIRWSFTPTTTVSVSYMYMPSHTTISSNIAFSVAFVSSKNMFSDSITVRRPPVAPQWKRERWPLTASWRTHIWYFVKRSGSFILFVYFKFIVPKLYSRTQIFFS